MLTKKLLGLLMALGLLMSTGCCRMWERWCDRPHNYQQPCCPQPCCPAPPSCPPPTSGFSSPVGAVPAPPPAPAGNWSRPCP